MTFEFLYGVGQGCIEKVEAVEEKFTSAKMLVHEAKERASITEQEFWQMKGFTDYATKEVITSNKKAKQAIEWLASMCKRMIETCKQEIKATKEARVEITRLKKDFLAKIVDLRKNS